MMALRRLQSQKRMFLSVPAFGIALNTSQLAEGFLWSRIRALIATTFIIAAFLHASVYDSLAPAFLIAVLAILCWFLVVLFGGKQQACRSIYLWLVSFYWMCAGGVAVLEGPTQVRDGTTVDAEKFYSLLASGNIASTLDDIGLQTTGSLAVMIWDHLYKAAQSIGVTHEPYIGVSLNVVLMAATGGITAAMVGRLYEQDLMRQRLVVLYFSSCGLFLLFAILHLRDAFISLSVTTNAYFWILYLQRRTLGKLFLVLALSPLFAACFYYLREPFVFVPVALAGVAIGATVVEDARHERASVWGVVVVSVASIAALSAHFDERPMMLEVIEGGRNAYTDFARAGANSDSLGMAIVVNQPWFVRIVVGPLYVLFMPIPVWRGFETGEEYESLKAIGAICFYFLVPRLMATVLTMLRISSLRSAPTVFLSAGFVAFLIIIGYSSMESRHIGAFIPLIIAASVAFDGNPTFERLNRHILIGTLVLIGIAHAAWLFRPLVF